MASFHPDSLQDTIDYDITAIKIPKQFILIYRGLSHNLEGFSQLLCNSVANLLRRGLSSKIGSPQTMASSLRCVQNFAHSGFNGASRLFKTKRVAK